MRRPRPDKPPPNAHARVDGGLHADQAGREVGEPRFHLAARLLLPQHDRTVLVARSKSADRANRLPARCGGPISLGRFRTLQPATASILAGCHERFRESDVFRRVFERVVEPDWSAVKGLPSMRA